MRHLQIVLCIFILSLPLALSGCRSEGAFDILSAEDSGGEDTSAAEEADRPEDPDLSEEMDPEEDAMVIFFATDLHYLASELTDKGAFYINMVENADGKVMMYSEELIDAFAAQVMEETPDVLILSGDLTFNGEKISHELLAEKLQALEEAGICVLVIPGNHDVNRSSAARFEGDGYEYVDSVTEDEFTELYREFGYSDAISSDTASLSYVAELSDDLWVMMVDVNTKEAGGSITDQTLSWVEDQIAAAAGAGVQVIAVSHQNLLDHSSLISSGFTIDNAGILLECYEDSAVVCNFSGHIHMQHIARSDTGFADIAGSSLAVSPNQYGVLAVSELGMTYHTETVDVSAWAEKQGLEDANLLNFAAYAEDFFRDTCIRQALAAVGEEEEAEEMAEFFAQVNAAYYAGRTDLLKWDDALLDRWLAGDSFLSSYIGSIAADEPRNSCEWSETSSTDG